MTSSSNTARKDTDDFQHLFLNDIPLLDARAPVEFNKGSFPSAVNLPLLTDIERQRIGTCYKQHGQAAAIEMGHQLVSGPVKAERVAAWVRFAQEHPEGYLFCFRGGLRSQIVQQWLSEAGVPYPRVSGGYKAMRRFLIDTLEDAIAQCRIVVVAGMTGTGKTEVIAALDNAIDLEGCANHRGSSFGRHALGQPSQIDFENLISIRALKLRDKGYRTLIVEDEGRLIGRCFVPLSLQHAIKTAPVVWLEDSFDGRVERILKDYVISMQAEYQALHPSNPQQAFDAFSAYLTDSLQRIHKRLGGQLHMELSAQMQEALSKQQKNGDASGHRNWITGLLTSYYDPMYDYQRGETKDILFRGNQDQVICFLRNKLCDHLCRG